MVRDTLTQDNEPDTFQPIGLAARRLLVKLEKEQQERPDNERGRSNENDKDRVEHARYVEQRLRDIERFERLMRGYYRPSRNRRK
jgi:hypothetical protein